VKYAITRRAYMDEVDVILKVLNDQIQILEDSLTSNLETLRRLRESLESYREYNSRVLESHDDKAPF
jgi:hypothetical protein